MYGYSISTLDNTKLGLLAKNGTITILDRNHPVKIVTPSGFIVGIEGQEYYEHIDEGNPSDYSAVLNNIDFSILVVHGMLLDHPFFNGINHTEISNVSTSADVLFAGHYHPGFTQVEQDGTTYCNPGSVLRIENTTENKVNAPKIAILDINETDGSFTITYHALTRAKAGDKVFVEKTDTKTYDDSLVQFHTKLKNSNFKGVDIIKMIDDYINDNAEDVNLGTIIKDKVNKFSINSVDTGFVPSQNNIYINRVEIKNFQAHAKKVIDFVNGLNVIKGESNSGKTAILRAIYWALYDKPNGSDFITTGAKSCSVKVHLSNGYIIERKRTRSSSGSFLLTSPDGKTEEFKGFANNIPIDIVNAHQMPELKINGSSYRINIASQLDAAFLIGNSPTERISMIGSLVDADRADEAKKDFLLEKRRKTTEKNQIDTILLSKQQELEKYAYLDKLSKNIQVLELALEKLKTDETEIADLEKLKAEYDFDNNTLSNIKNKVSSIQLVDKDLIHDFKDLLSELEVLDSLSKDNEVFTNEANLVTNSLKTMPDVDNINILIKEYDGLINSLEALKPLKLDYDTLSQMTFEFDYDLDDLNNLISEYSGLINEISDLDNLKSKRDKLESPSDLDEKINIIESNLVRIQNSKEEKIKELEKEDTTCPYCKQKIDYSLIL